MVKYQIDGGSFIINDYQKAKHFSSFLPSIAGIDGKPLWAFYANVGQCIGGFGINSKDTPMTPFDSAFLAYSNIPTKSFRTFVKVDDELIEPFNLEDECTLIIDKSKITIKSENKFFLIEVIYSTLSHHPYPGLIRKVIIKNKNSNHKYKIIDGLPVFLPKGADNYSYHELTTLVAAYCNVEINNNRPFFTYSNRGGDDAKVILKQDGNCFFSIDSKDNLMNVIVDPTIIFKHDSSLIRPLGFDNCFDTFVNQQIVNNQIPCAFSHNQIELSPREEYSFISFYSSFDSISLFNKEANKLNFTYLDKQINITEDLINSLLPVIKTSNHSLDEYVRQCFLDNGLRGGFPIDYNGKTLYLYSRKHGDMERDYNAFNIPSSFYSTGLGNYRDINQNRRNDLYLNPHINDSNVYLFLSLIEGNGFNPLVVDVSLLKQDYQTFKNASKAIDELNLNKIKASYVEGYWIDHFDYNLDLIENYLSIFPDKKEELFFTTKYKFYDSHIRIKPRKERYVLLSNGNIRQYDSLSLIEGLESNRLLDKDNNEIVVNLASKLFTLIVLKMADLDVDQMGIEMSTNKPGWNDSCNGLPGLFGSSMNETIELLRLVDFYIDEIIPFNKSVSFISPLRKLIDALTNHEADGFNYWNIVNTAKEEYLESYRHSFLDTFDADEIGNILSLFKTVLNDAISKSISLNNGAIPTYFYHEVEKYHLDNGVVVDSFKTIVLPIFLEAPARLGKLGNQYLNKEQLSVINKSELLDKKLKIYKTSVSLDKENKELGRICSFRPGWLERESDFLHMTFKYLLGLLYAGYYKEFFIAAKNNIPCFMEPNIYGRSIFENVSFIVPSNHSNESLHGQGFYARLTGANTEIINMLYLLCFGKKIFDFVNNNLTFVAKPHIPLALFDNGEIVIPLFKDTNIHFINKNNRDFDQQNSVSYLIDNHEYENVPNDVAIKIRNKEIKEIFVIIK